MIESFAVCWMGEEWGGLNGVWEAYLFSKYVLWRLFMGGSVWRRRIGIMEPFFYLGNREDLERGYES